VGSVELLDTHREGAFTMRRFAPVEPAPQRRAGKAQSEAAGESEGDMSMSENGSAYRVDVT